MLTFLSYTCFHLSRKAISVVKPVLIDCDNVTDTCTSYIREINGTAETEAKSLEGTLDTAFLFSYAVFMFVRYVNPFLKSPRYKIDLEFYFSGFVAERMNLRYFLSIGMILSGVLTFLFGFAKVMDIHSIYYFVTIQVSISYSLGPLCF